MLCLWRLGLYGDAAFQAALPGSRGAAYLQQRGMPLALAQQCGVGYAAPGSWPHAARD
jgi:DNA primase